MGRRETGPRGNRPLRHFAVGRAAHAAPPAEVVVRRDLLESGLLEETL